MDAKLEQLEATLNNINVFNAGKKREEAVALLAQLLPEVESFQAETQRLRDTIAHERRNASFQREINADLRNELKAERSHSFDQSIKLSELERRCKRAEKLLSKIPQEELDTITWIIGCIGFYKFLPYYVRFKRRRWYRKILQRKKYAIRVLILASHLELYNSEGKPVIFIYKAQIKKGKRNLPKKHQMIGEIIEAKNGMYFVGSDIELVDVGPVLFVDKNDVPAEDYSKLREMLKGVFLEKYYDYSAE